MNKFKNSLTLDQRIKKSELIKIKHPNLIPVIIEKYSNNKAPDLDRNKYLITKDSQFNVLANLIRNSIKLDKSKALFFYTNNKLINQADLMSVLYNNHKDKDGFLYIEYAYENTFGN
jgi:GABA(A) receptor-associated protein